MIEDKIENIKKNYYLQDNKEEFDKLCRQNIELPKDIINYCKKNDIELINAIDYDDLEPSGEWCFKYPSYEKEEFRVRYRGRLRVSKLDKIYSLTHEATIDNIDPDRVDPDVSDSSNDVPMCKHQFFIEEMVTENFKEYDRMWWVDTFQHVDGLIFNRGTVSDRKPSQRDIAFDYYIDEIEPENKYKYDENTFGF